jgi:hypothetical protein
MDEVSAANVLALMAMRLTRRSIWFAGLLLPAVLVLAGCRDVSDSADAASVPKAGAASSGTAAAGCGQPGPGVAQWLPRLDPAQPGQRYTTVKANPCLPFSGLLGWVSGLVPEREVTKTAERKAAVSAFHINVKAAADRFLQAEDGLECGYETDSLAVDFYQDSKNPWSVGLVVVVRLSVRAAVDVGFCYLGKQLGYDAPPLTTAPSGGHPLTPGFCGLAAKPEASNGEDYAVVALGTSNWMCDALATSRAGLVKVL